MPPIWKLVDLLLSIIHAVNWRTEEARNEALRLWHELSAHAEDQIEADEPRTPTPVLAELTEKIASLGEKNMDLQRELDAARAELGRLRMDNDAVHRDLTELRAERDALVEQLETRGESHTEPAGTVDDALHRIALHRIADHLRIPQPWTSPSETAWRVIAEINRLRAELETAEQERDLY